MSATTLENRRPDGRVIVGHDPVDGGVEHLFDIALADLGSLPAIEDDRYAVFGDTPVDELLVALAGEMEWGDFCCGNDQNIGTAADGFRSGWVDKLGQVEEDEVVGADGGLDQVVVVDPRRRWEVECIIGEQEIDALQGSDGIAQGRNFALEGLGQSGLDGTLGGMIEIEAKSA